MPIFRNVDALARAQIATGLGIIVFWLLFFMVGLAPANAPACYLAFEHAFPLADMVLAGGLLVAGTFLIAGRPEGRSLGLMAGGGLLFLGLVDASFNARNGIYIGNLLDGLGNAAINLWCITLGILSGIAMIPLRASQTT
jgi:hypothetical protein